MAYSERNGLASSEERRSIEETISRKSKGKNNTLNAEGTSSISETKSDVEDTRRSLRQGTFIRGENEKEIGQGNADLTQRSGEASQFDVANTKGSSRNVNEINGEYGETETQEILGDGSSLSRTQVESPWEGWWDIEPDVGRVAHGVSARTHRLKGLGNSLVPAIPYHIGNVILEVMKNG